MVALNSSFLELNRLQLLCKENLLVNISRNSRRGLIQAVDPTKTELLFTAQEVTSGRAVIYSDIDKNNDFMYDSILLEIFLSSEIQEIRKKSIRVELPIIFLRNDPQYQVSFIKIFFAYCDFAYLFLNRMS